MLTPSVRDHRVLLIGQSHVRLVYLNDISGFLKRWYVFEKTKDSQAGRSMSIVNFQSSATETIINILITKEQTLEFSFQNVSDLNTKSKRLGQASEVTD